MSVKDLSEKYDAMKKEFSDKISAELVKETVELFVKYPKLESFGWPQYAPYFNDGEACTFSVHSYAEEIHINGYSEYDEDDELEEYNGITTEVDNKWKKECRDVIADLIGEVPEDVLESAYGEGLVVINKDGTSDTEEYSHD